MIKEVAAVQMPANERIVIRKNRLMPKEPSEKMMRVSIVTGIHGDELDGQYICYQLNKVISENIDKLKGIVDIYPAVNPLGMESCTRGMPMFDLDMNRVFPGYENGATAEYLASQIVDDIIGSDMCIDLHSSNIFIKEAPQVRVFDEYKDKLMPYAGLLNADFIWEYKISTVLEATLANSLNKLGVPTFVIEMGEGFKIEKKYGNQITEGICNLLSKLGIWEGDIRPVRTPMISSEGEIHVIHAKHTGLFVPALDDAVLKTIKSGDHIGDIVNPTTGEIFESIFSDWGGTVFTFREHPIVYEGAILCRVFSKK